MKRILCVRCQQPSYADSEKTNGLGPHEYAPRRYVCDPHDAFGDVEAADGTVKFCPFCGSQKVTTDPEKWSMCIGQGGKRSARFDSKCDDCGRGFLA